MFGTDSGISLERHLEWGLQGFMFGAVTGDNS
jgi:hypothetical protein